jgi:DNA-binding response OmpR family regulator
MTEKVKNGTTILLVEDDATVASAVTEMLELNGYTVWRAEDGNQAKMLVEEKRPDLVVLDLILPDVDGLVLCADLKATADVPVVICGATTRKRDAVLALRLGADDFVPKPFDVDELAARVAAVLRRAGHSRGPAEPAAAPDQLRIGELSVDRARHRVSVGGDVVHLTPIEYRLLIALMSRPHEVLSRADLARTVWGHLTGGRTIEVHVRRLRVKLGGAGVLAPTIVSVRGVGYGLEVPAATTGRTAGQERSAAASTGRRAGAEAGGQRTGGEGAALGGRPRPTGGDGAAPPGRRRVPTGDSSASRGTTSGG